MSSEIKRGIASHEPPAAEPESPLAETVIGAAGGAVAGAVTGISVGGAVGAAVGGAVGALAGGVAGHAASEGVDPEAEDMFWRNNYMKRPYYRSTKTYSDYQPAYRYGWESASLAEFHDRHFEDAESDLEKGWDRGRGVSRERWYEVRDAARDAWKHIRP